MLIIQHCTRHSECKIGFGDLILLSRYFFRQQLSTDPNVKIKFDKLKSVLYKSGDNSLHKQRAASAIVIALQEHNRVDEVNTVLDTLSDEITKEYTDKLWGRLAYLAGTLSITLLAIIAAFLAYTFRDITFFKSNTRNKKYDLLVLRCLLKE